MSPRDEFAVENGIETDEERAKYDKKKRIVIGATVGGVLLFIFLLIILVTQFVKIGVKSAENNKIKKQIDEFQRLSEDLEKNIEFYNSEDGLRMWAVWNGYTNK